MQIWSVVPTGDSDTFLDLSSSRTIQGYSPVTHKNLVFIKLVCTQFAKDSNLFFHLYFTEVEFLRFLEGFFLLGFSTVVMLRLSVAVTHTFYL